MNHHPPTETQIQTVPLAGFSARSTPEGACISTWADTIELVAELTPNQTKLLAQALTSNEFFAGASHIKKFTIQTL